MDEIGKKELLEELDRVSTGKRGMLPQAYKQLVKLIEDSKPEVVDGEDPDFKLAKGSLKAILDNLIDSGYSQADALKDILYVIKRLLSQKRAVSREALELYADRIDPIFEDRLCELVEIFQALGIEVKEEKEDGCEGIKGTPRHLV